MRLIPRWSRAAAVATLCIGGMLAAGTTPAAAEHGPCLVSVADTSVTEGNTGTVNATFTVTASALHGGCAGVAVTYATADGSATNPDDFTAKTGTLTFSSAPGGSQTVTVPVVGDTVEEGDDAFFLNIDSASGTAIVTDPQATAVIRGDDGTTQEPTLLVGDLSVFEGDSDRSASFTLSLSRAATADVTIPYTFTPGTAVKDADYKVTSTTGSATIFAGQTTATVSFIVAGNDNEEPDKRFTLDIGAVTGAEKSDTSGVAIILDDDRIGQTGANGYRMVASDGGVFTFGDRDFHGSTGDRVLNKPIVGGATDVSDYDGYWIVASDGGVFNFGAEYYGSLGDKVLTSPAVEIEPTPTGNGYWIVQADGTVTAFGPGARHHGDASKLALNKPIIGMSVAPDGLGYWLVAEDGGIFDFGSADFYGSMGATKLNAPVIDIAPMPDGGGYYLVAKDGGVFTFGTALWWGSTGDRVINQPVIGMLVVPSGAGYWLAAADGGIFSFGPQADYHGSMGATKLNAPVLDLIN